MSLLENFIEDTNAAKTKEEVFALYAKALESIGFNRIVYSLITDHPSLGLAAGHGVVRNYPENWMQHYAEQGYESKDPVPKYAFSTNKPFTWDWLIENLELSNIEMQVMNEARDARLLNGVGIPIYGMNGEIAGVGLANDGGKLDLDQNAMSRLKMLTTQFHLVYTEKEASEEAREMRQVKLTQREKEILHWTAEGKSSEVIAEIIGISYNTVRFHMNNVFTKLNANERALATAKAIRYGLILPSFVDVDSLPNRVAR